MNSNYIRSKSEMRRISTQIAKEEIAKYEVEVCPKCQTSIGYQAIATMLWVLHRDFGWGTVRLNRLKDACEAEFSLMEGIQGMPKFEYTANDCVRGLKEIGVDMEASQYEQKTV